MLGGFWSPILLCQHPYLTCWPAAGDKGLKEKWSFQAFFSWRGTEKGSWGPVAGWAIEKVPGPPARVVLLTSFHASESD